MELPLGNVGPDFARGAARASSRASSPTSSRSSSPASSRTLFGLLALVFLLSSGCVAQRIVPPTLKASAPARPADMTHFEIELCAFSVDGQSSADVSWSVRELGRSFRAYLEQSANFAAVRDCSTEVQTSTTAAPSGTEVVQLIPSVHLEADTHRTYFLEALSLYPFIGMFPFLPEWGRATVKLRISLLNGARSRRSNRRGVGASGAVGGSYVDDARAFSSVLARDWVARRG